MRRPGNPVGCDGKGGTTMIARTAATRSDASVATILFAALLGAALLFAAGFAQPEALHDVAHDTRHSVGFPCH